ncbi:hypothetical protein Cgig2_016645 [Carnegiea gigantea]|uniref:Cyanobacterial aminoacyl-tRNA synthetase CAAD domain-containing protein n=1 Tax=Carnegiea gigantea TaxID=171969 RepID=A0A9Q1L039_9CARY|nr:hypothetical protein Cgig2_016645 [Carnegiea gigantea]
MVATLTGGSECNLWQSAKLGARKRVQAAFLFADVSHCVCLVLAFACRLLDNVQALIAVMYSSGSLLSSELANLDCSFMLDMLHIERRHHLAVVVKATGDSSDSSTSLSIVKSVQNVWDKPEDRVGVIGLGLTAIIALWASSNLVSAIDKLPLIPSFLELVGILFSSAIPL